MAASLMITLTGCNSEITSSANESLTPTLESIEVAVDASYLLKGSKKAIVNPGSKIVVASTGKFSDGSKADLTDDVQWLVNGQSVPQDEGKILIPTDVNGVVTISSVLNAIHSNSLALDVNHSPVASLTVMASGDFYDKGAMQQYAALATYVDGTSSDVTNLVEWASSNSDSTVINKEGFAFSVASGESGISASFAGLVSDNQISHTATQAQVETETDVVGVVISNGHTTVELGDTFNYQAVAGFTNGDLRYVTNEVDWHVNDVDVASIVQGGIATALNVGETEVWATFGGQTSESGTFIVVDDTEHDAIAELFVSPNNATLAVGESRPYYSSVFYRDGRYEDVTHLVEWVSTNEDAATISTTGMATALNLGVTEIFAILDGFEGTPVNLNVGTTLINEITVDIDSQNMNAGTTKQLRATAHYTDGTTEDITDLVSWSAGTSAVLTVDSTGLATAHDAGVSTLSATLDGIRSSVMLMYVSDVDILLLAVSPEAINMSVGESRQASAMVFYSMTDYEDVTQKSSWSTTNTSVVSVDRVTGLLVAQGPGTAEVRAVFNNVISDQPIFVTVE